MTVRWIALWSLIVPAGIAAADWPQYLGPQRDGTAPRESLVAWPAAGPQQVWGRDIGAGFAGPVVAGGKVLLYHRVGDEEVLEALDAATGKALWKHTAATDYIDDFGFDDGPRATPLIADGIVYTLGAAGRLSAVEFDTGKLIWSRPLATDYQAPKGFFGFACSPIQVGKRILINLGGKGAGVVAFDRATGKEVWRASDDAASYSSPVAAMVAGQLTVLFLTRDGLLGVNPEDGAIRYRKRWRARIAASVNAATPLVVGDEIFLTSSYGVGAILLKAGAEDVAEVWSGDESLSSQYNTAVVRDGFLYGIDGRQEGGAARLRCVDWATGKVRWSKERFGCASLILVGGELLALTEQGELVRLPATPNEPRETARAAILNTTTRAAPALANGRLYARDTKRLVCMQVGK